MKSGQNFNFCCIDPGLARSLPWQANRDAQLWVEMARNIRLTTSQRCLK